MSSDSFVEVPQTESSSSQVESSSSQEEPVSSGSVQRNNCKSLWTVPNFSSTIISSGLDHFSPSFSSTDEPNYRWFLGFKINDVDDQKYIEVFLKPDFPSSNSKSCFFDYTLSVENSNGLRIAEWNLESGVTDQVWSRTLHRLKCSDIVGVVVDDELFLRAEITFVLFEMGSYQDDFRRCISVRSNHKILGDLSAMLGSQTFSDVEITIDDSGTLHAIPAHQMLLAARSPVFRAKLTQDTPESRDRRIHMPDLDIQTVRNMLAYMYTDKYDERMEPSKVMKLLKCADKYSVEGLKNLCEIHLIRQMNEANAFDCLVTADLYNAKELKTKALEIICRNKKSIGTIKQALTSSMGEMSQEQRLCLLTEIILHISTSIAPN